MRQLQKEVDHKMELLQNTSHITSFLGFGGWGANQNFTQKKLISTGKHKHGIQSGQHFIFLQICSLSLHRLGGKKRVFDQHGVGLYRHNQALCILQGGQFFLSFSKLKTVLDVLKYIWMYQSGSSYVSRLSLFVRYFLLIVND